jgi:exodeoxyribonuclease VII small subunit
MKDNLTFDKAYAAIEDIVRQIENEAIPLDELADKVKMAKELIAFCNNKLRDIEAEIKSSSSENTSLE